MSNPTSTENLKDCRAGVITCTDPVFVVGMHGSGTTMLLDHLNSHPGLYGFPLETKILPYYLRRQSRFGGLEDDVKFLNLFDEIRAAFPFRIMNGGLPVHLPADWRDLPRTPAAVFDRLMTCFASRENKTRWCEKSPMHVMHIAELARAWPGAQFIHIIRDGRDCAASFHRRWGYTPEATICRWKRCIRAGREQGPPLGEQRYIEVRYEALTAHPEPELRRICRYLRVDFTDALLASSRSAKRVRGLDSKNIRPNDRSHTDHFSAMQCDRLERIAGSMLANLGYSTQHPLSDKDPPSAKLRLWSFRDRLRVGAFAVFEKLSTGRGPSWNLMIKKLQRSLRQTSSDDI
jgi:hypothetical protein